MMIRRTGTDHDDQRIDHDDLRKAISELSVAVTHVRDLHKSWNMPPAISMPQAPANPSSAVGWNFDTFEKYINQRFIDLSMQLRERYEAQQTGVTAALAAAEKAVNAALIAAEKAVDKAERAQELRNQVANEFRESLSDLSGLMWTTQEGTATVNSLRREITATIENLAKQLPVLERSVGDNTTVLRRETATLVTGVTDRVSATERQVAEITIREASRKEGVSTIGAIIMAVVSGIAAAAAVGTMMLKWNGVG